MRRFKKSVLVYLAELVCRPQYTNLGRILITVRGVRPAKSGHACGIDELISKVGGNAVMRMQRPALSHSTMDSDEGGLSFDNSPFLMLRVSLLL